ncbi:MAG: S8 family serine peptidase [Actinobacteria bacterium]|nr:S8 family serine peptidase [Actinomycetota bacterium]
MPGRYLVETVGRPLVRGGSSSSNDRALAAARSAARSAGASVDDSFSALWTGISVEATDEQVRELATSPAVTAIYPVLRVARPRTTPSPTRASSMLGEIGAAGLTWTGQGIKIGVIDSGIDLDNPDLGGGGTNGGTSFPSARVAYGYDFVGDNYDADGASGSPSPSPDARPDDCGGHGTHVAGIIGANGTGAAGVVGVAPQVTFGAYRIFGCEGSTSTDLIVSALTRARSDGMDVVNLSLGMEFESWPGYPSSVAATNLAAAGVNVVVSAGNSGDLGLFVAGAPASAPGIVTVASYESTTIRVRSIGVGTSKLPYIAVHGAATPPADDTSTLSLRAASNGNACTAPSVVPSGTALLVKYGACRVSSQLTNSFNAGAAAVVIYNDEPSLSAYGTGGVSFGKPAIGIAGSQGATLAAKIKKSGPQTMTWQSLSELSNPDGGRISTFSSAGLTADLRLTPTISAPGGKVYSTLPIEQGGHGNLSGTSMASPYVAGTVALMLQAHPALKGRPEQVAQLLYNTANPVMKSTESGVTKRPEAVFRQGSGLVQAATAIDAGVTASPSVLELGEGTTHTAVVTLTNNTTSILTYKPTRVSGASAAASTGKATRVGTSTPKYGFGDVGFKASPKIVTLAPGASAAVTLTLKAPAKVLKGKAGLLYGGWVRFTTTGAGNTVTVPFAGLRGDYQAVKQLNKFTFVTSSAKYSLPMLGYSNGSGIYYGLSQSSNAYTFNLSSFYPVVIFHLDYAASDVRLKVTNTATKQSYWALITTTGATAEARTHRGPTARDDFANWVVLGRSYLDAGGNAATLPNGNYQLQLNVLKPLGNPGTSKHWETYSSPKFNVG